MSLVSGSIPTLSNGVTQQPLALRLPSQATVQENAYSSLVEGLTKRPPTEHVAKLLNTIPADALVHFIDRDEDEKYVAVFQTSGVRVFDLLTGQEFTVINNAFYAYLNCPAPSRDLRALTLADTTFVTNRTVVTEMEPHETDTPPFVAFVYIRQGNYSTNYRVRVKTPAGPYADEVYTTLASTAGGAANDIKTENIADNLISQLYTNALLPPVDWSISGAGTGLGSFIRIQRVDGAPEEEKRTHLVLLPASRSLPRRRRRAVRGGAV